MIREEAKIGFVYGLEVVGVDGRVKWRGEFKNRIPNEGRDYLLTAGLMQGAQIGNWYIGLYANNYLPVAGDTMASLMAAGLEVTNYTSASNYRLTLQPDPLSGGVYSNASNRAEFEFPAGATIRGGFITSNQLRGSNTGLLLSAVRFPTMKAPEAGEILRVVGGLLLNT